jgi:hypothetical protein
MMRRGHFRGEFGGWQRGEQPPADDAADWLGGRLPEGWFTGTPEVTVDREEIVIVGTLPAPEVAADATPEATSAAEDGRIGRFREETRDERIGIAREAEARYRRKVAWGAQIGDTRQLFTVAAVPVMTRLRQPDRRVLDTLVDAGVARSRADALAWCVRLVGQHADTWLDELREAMTSVDEVRTRGPEL